MKISLTYYFNRTHVALSRYSHNKKAENTSPLFAAMAHCYQVSNPGFSIADFDLENEFSGICIKKESKNSATILLTNQNSHALMSLDTKIDDFQTRSGRKVLLSPKSGSYKSYHGSESLISEDEASQFSLVLEIKNNSVEVITLQ